MRASLLRNVEYKTWKGATVPDSTKRPFVISEPVPKGRIWIVLGVSGADNFPGNEALWLLTLPPPASYGGGIFGATIASQVNTPPLSQAAQVSLGGQNLTTQQMLVFGQNANSVNLLCGKFRRFVLPPEWSMILLEDATGGGGQGFVTLNAMIIEQSLN